MVGFPRRSFGLFILLFGVLACANPTETERPPPVDAGVPVDAGTPPVRGLKLKSSHLTPATGRASGPAHNMEARIGAAGAARSTSGGYRLRGGIVAGGAHTSTTTN